ncbi:MAG: glucosidase [Anaerolineae bacterium]
MTSSNREADRLGQARTHQVPWRKWGPYLSERQWGTVREDYSDSGDAWNYFTHDQARARAYKWGEDGIAGISDDKQALCWALALWNGHDPIIKERLFGLANSEANHGEDVKEYYFYLDSTPTHSWMKYLYKYPQQAYPYDELVRVNSQRTREEMEYELIDTGAFDDDRYFDIYVEFAKADPEDILIKVSAANRGPEAASLHILPHLWFRNTWWMQANAPLPALSEAPALPYARILAADHPELGKYYLYIEGPSELLFTNNESNTERLWGEPNKTPFVKDGINNYLLHGQTNAVNPDKTGTKAAANCEFTIDPGATAVLRMRLTRAAPSEGYLPFGDDYEDAFHARRQEADEFYGGLTPASFNEDQASVMRQALAGMLWSKQYYMFDLDLWLEEHNANPVLGMRRPSRNRDWYHMLSDHIISMPDKWEYPWFAAWDLAFHTVALNMVDPDFARDQLKLMLREEYQHPSGQIPAYEWNFSDVNPPVHAWATLANFGDDLDDSPAELPFIKSAYKKLLLNFNWWVNRKDPLGRNVFNGGFLGLDNIGVFDRSSALPTGGVLEQADGTAWMAFYCLNMLELSAKIAAYDPSYEEFVLKFLEHFLWIAGSMDRVGDNKDELWDEADGFFYDVLIMPDGTAERIKVRSMVGLLPLIATAVFNEAPLRQFPSIRQRALTFIRRRPELLANIHPLDKPGKNGRLLVSAVNEDKLRRILARMLDEERFLSPYGIRSLSRWHLDHPYVINVSGEEYRVQYLPAESNTGMFGGNSNWRGPIWMPVNALIIRALMQFYSYYGDDFKVEMPTGSGAYVTLFEVAKELSERLGRIFLRDATGRRPVYGGTEKFQADPYWRDNILFYEYFHGDNGAGLGASHQTGWTGLVARLIQIAAVLKPEDMFRAGVHFGIDAYVDDAVDAAEMVVEDADTEE